MDDPVTFARKLRRQQTPAERRFWALLHPWRSAGMHWRRQAPVGPYVVDFVCKAQKEQLNAISAKTPLDPIGSESQRSRYR